LLRMKESNARLAQDMLHRGTIHAWNSFKDQIPIRMFRVPDVTSFIGLEYAQL
jgi:hypothetical protein